MPCVQHWIVLTPFGQGCHSYYLLSSNIQVPLEKICVLLDQYIVGCISPLSTHVRFRFIGSFIFLNYYEKTGTINFVFSMATTNCTALAKSWQIFGSFCLKARCLQLVSFCPVVLGLSYLSFFLYLIDLGGRMMYLKPVASYSLSHFGERSLLTYFGAVVIMLFGLGQRFLTLWRLAGFGNFRKKTTLNARGFAREFLRSSMLYRPSKSLKRRGKTSSLHSKKFFLLGDAVFCEWRHKWRTGLLGHLARPWVPTVSW